MQQFSTQWPILLGLAVIVLLTAWWLFTRATRTVRPPARRPDVLDEGAAPAQRNQALIDSAPAAAASAVPPAAEMMGGIAEVIAAAVQEEAAQAGGIETATGVPDRPVDDLTRIKGLGPKLNTLLGQLGVTSFAQIASWTDEDLARIDSQLGSFAGRPARDQWVAQARLLAAGDTAGYEDAFGKL